MTHLPTLYDRPSQASRPQRTITPTQYLSQNGATGSTAVDHPNRMIQHQQQQQLDNFSQSPTSVLFDSSFDNSFSAATSSRSSRSSIVISMSSNRFKLKPRGGGGIDFHSVMPCPTTTFICTPLSSCPDDSCDPLPPSIFLPKL